MALILSLDTTTKVCSAALSRDGAVIVMKESHDDSYTHAEKLHVFINGLFSESGINRGDIDAVAVAEGPGSYTGLRIGVSAAKGICYALNKRLISVNPLAAMAKAVASEYGPASGIIQPMIDARRWEVFTAAYDHKGGQIKEVSAEILTEENFQEADVTVYLAGDGAPKFQPWYRNRNHVIFTGIEASAKWISVLAEEKFQAGDFADVAYFEPVYGKEFQTTVPRKS